jgi:hypothetical protein
MDFGSYKNFPLEIWKKKAMAFLIRTIHQLWGKKSEDVQALLFVLGFKNSFIMDMMFGWNKKLTLRPSESFGINDSSMDHIEFKQGIVIPYIKDKVLLKLFIAGFDDKGLHETLKIKGSSSEPVFWTANSKYLLLSKDMLLSCYLKQEFGDQFDILNFLEDEIEDQSLFQELFKKYEKIFVFNLNEKKLKEFKDSLKKFEFIQGNPFDKNFDSHLIFSHIK